MLISNEQGLSDKAIEKISDGKYKSREEVFGSGEIQNDSFLTEEERMAKEWSEMADDPVNEDILSTRVLNQDELDSLLGFDREEEVYTDYGKEVSPNDDMLYVFEQFFNGLGYKTKTWVRIQQPLELYFYKTKYNLVRTEKPFESSFNIYFSDRSLVKHFGAKLSVDGGDRYSSERESFVSYVNLSSKTREHIRGYLIFYTSEKDPRDVKKVFIENIDEYIFHKNFHTRQDMRDKFKSQYSPYERDIWSINYKKDELKGYLSSEVSYVDMEIMQSGDYIEIENIIPPKGFKLSIYNDKLYFVKE